MADHCHRRRRCVATIKLKLADNFSSSVCQCRRALGLVLNSSAQASYITGLRMGTFQDWIFSVRIVYQRNCSWATLKDVTRASHATSPMLLPVCFETGRSTELNARGQWSPIVPANGCLAKLLLSPHNQIEGSSPPSRRFGNSQVQRICTYRGCPPVVRPAFSSFTSTQHKARKPEADGSVSRSGIIQHTPRARGSVRIPQPISRRCLVTLEAVPRRLLPGPMNHPSRLCIQSHCGDYWRRGTDSGCLR